MLSIEVSSLLKDSRLDLELSLVAGQAGLDRRINIPRIQKPGLALIGDTSKLHSGRVQVLGKSEITYLNSLDEKKQNEVIVKMCKENITCFVVTRNITAPQILVNKANHYKIPLLSSKLVTSTFINRVTRFLEEQLTATTTIHGVLMDIFGIGILITGRSGIGKSECALDLILKGHRLVADDAVIVSKIPPATLYGQPSEILKYHLEIRGLGILNTKDLFGVASTLSRKQINVVVELVEWNPDYEYDRLGLDDLKELILEVPVPYLKLPVSPGRNVSTIIEVAARNELLKMQGYHASRMFQDKLNLELLTNEAHDKDKK